MATQTNRGEAVCAPVTDANLDDANDDGDGANGHGKNFAVRTVSLVARVDGNALQDATRNTEDREGGGQRGGNQGSLNKNLR